MHTASALAALRQQKREFVAYPSSVLAACPTAVPARSVSPGRGGFGSEPEAAALKCQQVFVLVGVFAECCLNPAG